ncbi:hypothetical protein SAMN05444003_1024 [Cognatiyoonia sediminum]|uniref:Uncharacterized protein n=1 Tax=Cognatiyoonia sediminum TaxID=1508389 RepID=A0A1M5MUF5_9RHOB|nr:hypothetical protein [Cognatiyoonia sediminum]SHG80835.1 hypothetical protein SAMN05444003_1024 [Cognatiyoonia sediminum]
MRSWVLFIPFAALVVLSGYLGYQMGKVAPPSEGDVIARWAEKYVAWAGGDAKATDCSATPGRGEVWMIITCVPDAPQQSISYQVNRAGQLVQPGAGQSGPEA